MIRLFVNTFLLGWIPFFLFWCAVYDPISPFLTFKEMNMAVLIAALFVTSVRASTRRLL